MHYIIAGLADYESKFWVIDMIPNRDQAHEYTMYLRNLLAYPYIYQQSMKPEFLLDKPPYKD